MAPIHHHYELKGWPEPRVIVRFWIIPLMLVLDWSGNAEGTLIMADYQGKMSSLSAWASPGFPAWTFPSLAV